MNKAWQGFRLVMMGLMIMAILGGGFFLYHHVKLEGLIILLVGMSGLSFYAFRLGICWNGENNKVSTLSQSGKLEDNKE